MIRFILIFIPVVTFFIPMRFFAFYATVMAGVAAYVVMMFTLLADETNQAIASFGVEAVAGYIVLNLILLGVRFWLIRRARARILKLPAPQTKE